MQDWVPSEKNEQQIRRELGMWRRISVVFFVMLFFIVTAHVSKRLVQSRKLNLEVQSMERDALMIAQWHQRYKSTYQTDNMPLLFSLADMAVFLEEEMQQDGMAASEVEALAAYWSKRGYFLLGRSNHALIAPIGRQLCRAIGEEKEPSKTLLHAILRAYETDNIKPWCYTLTEKETREFTPDFLWRGEEQEARRLMIMIMPDANTTEDELHSI